MDSAQEGLLEVKVGSVALARAMTKALKAMEEVPAEVAGAVNEHVAAARLAVSLDVLRKDRRTGRLGIPFIKIGEGKRGLVRYDLADLDQWIADKKRVGRAPASQVLPVVAEQPALEAQPIVEPEPVPEPPRRPSPPQTPWEALAETVLAELEDEPLDDPFAAGRSPRRSPGGYFRGGF